MLYIQNEVKRSFHPVSLVDLISEKIIDGNQAINFVPVREGKAIEKRK